MYAVRTDLISRQASGARVVSVGHVKSQLASYARKCAGGTHMKILKPPSPSIERKHRKVNKLQQQQHTGRVLLSNRSQKPGIAGASKARRGNPSTRLSEPKLFNTTFS